LQSPAGEHASPVDVPDLPIEPMVGYMIEQELGDLLPAERPVATILATAEVDRNDPSFMNPTRFVGPAYDKRDADFLTSQKQWVFRPDGDKWRRVVASPEPTRMFDLRPIQWLLERDTVVIATGGSGVSRMYTPGADRRFAGVDCVVDKDSAAELLARELRADMFVMLTDIDAVYADWGKPTQRAIRRASPVTLRSMSFAGGMQVKVKAACRFATATRRKCAIGALGDLERILAGSAGTTITASETDVVYESHTTAQRA